MIFLGQGKKKRELPKYRPSRFVTNDSGMLATPYITFYSPARSRCNDCEGVRSPQGGSGFETHWPKSPDSIDRWIPLTMPRATTHSHDMSSKNPDSTTLFDQPSSDAYDLPEGLPQGRPDPLDHSSSFHRFHTG